jgi:hypothetical protein
MATAPTSGAGPMAASKAEFRQLETGSQKTDRAPAPVDTVPATRL